MANKSSSNGVSNFWIEVWMIDGACTVSGIGGLYSIGSYTGTMILDCFWQPIEPQRSAANGTLATWTQGTSPGGNVDSQTRNETKILKRSVFWMSLYLKNIYSSLRLLKFQTALKHISALPKIHNSGFCHCWLCCVMKLRFMVIFFHHWKDENF